MKTEKYISQTSSNMDARIAQICFFAQQLHQKKEEKVSGET